MRVRTGLIGATTAALALAISGSAVSQDSESAVREYLDDAAATHTENGHRASGSAMIASLDMHGALIRPVQVRAGRTYVFYAVCDDSCSDVDMEVYDVDGTMAEQDILPDDTPFVQLTPTRSGRAYVRVWLASCVSERCTVGTRTMYGGTRVERSQPLFVAPEQNDWPEVTLARLNEYGQRHLDARFAVLASEGEEITPVQVGPEGHARSYALEAGRTYRFQGSCDQDCNDIDLEVLDSEGVQLAMNDDFDNNPFVEFTPETAGAYSVRVYLPQQTSCSVEPCYVGLRGYERR